MSKVALIRKPRDYYARDSRTVPLTQALPFFRSKHGRYIHRVRSGSLHRIHAQPHMSFDFWCGNCGTMGTDFSKRGGGELFAVPPENAVFCATCEGRAIGAGMDGARVIGGRTVLYSPRV